MKVISFKADEGDINRWKEDAYQARITMGEWIRRKLNGGVPAAPVLLEQLKPRVVGSARCEHRIPPGTWCKRCERMKK